MPSVYDISAEFLKLDMLLEESGGEWTPEIEAWAQENAALAAGKADRITAIWRQKEDQRVALASGIARMKAMDAVTEKEQTALKRLVGILIDAGKVKELPGTIDGTWKRVGNGGKYPVRYPVPTTDERPDWMTHAAAQEIVSCTKPVASVPVIDTETVYGLFMEFEAKEIARLTAIHGAKNPVLAQQIESLQATTRVLLLTSTGLQVVTQHEDGSLGTGWKSVTPAPLWLAVQYPRDTRIELKVKKAKEKTEPEKIADGLKKRAALPSGEEAAPSA